MLVEATSRHRKMSSKGEIGKLPWCAPALAAASWWKVRAGL